MLNEQFLVARRLVEAGARFVTVAYGFWDYHGNNFGNARNDLPLLDQALSALVEDLHDRGLDRDVSVIAWGEFGRTPRINKDAGRDHWAPLNDALLIGGGLRMGQAVGASTARGERPKDRPYTVPQVRATIYRALGIDPAQTFLNGSGRPMYILDDRETVRELVG